MIAFSPCVSAAVRKDTALGTVPDRSVSAVESSDTMSESARRSDEAEVEAGRERGIKRGRGKGGEARIRRQTSPNPKKTIIQKILQNLESN